MNPRKDELNPELLNEFKALDSNMFKFVMNFNPELIYPNNGIVYGENIPSK